MCEYLAATGMEVIIMDNLSTYPPLLEWYRSCPYEVIRMKKNHGHTVLWKTGLIDEFDDRYYCVSDPDLDLSGIPTDYLDVLLTGLEANPDVYKAGFSLRIDDLPQNAYTKKVIEWEKKFWTQKANASFMRADLDTTFALYSKDRDFGLLPPEGKEFHWAVRSPEPYVCRHLPWYLTTEELERNEEENYFMKTTSTHWAQRFKETML